MAQEVMKTYAMLVDDVYVVGLFSLGLLDPLLRSPPIIFVAFTNRHGLTRGQQAVLQR